MTDREGGRAFSMAEAQAEQTVRDRRRQRQRRDARHRTNPANGESHVPLADRLADAFDELDAAYLRLWKVDRRLLSHQTEGGAATGGHDPSDPEAARLREERHDALLAHEFAKNQVDRIKLEIALYESGGLPD